MNKTRRAIDPAAVKRLASTYKISEGNLALNLTGIGNGYLWRRGFAEQEPSAKHTDRQLAKMRKAARDLRQKISGADPSLHSLIEYVYKDLDKLNDSLVEFEKSITGIKQKSPKKNSDNLIMDIAYLWQLYTGQSPTRSSKPGQFLAFMCECADILDIDSSPLPERFAYLKKLKKL